MSDATQIKDEIGVFLDTCLKTHGEFLEKIKTMVSKTSTLKYKAVSKYHVTEAGVDTLTRRMRNTFLAKINTLTAYYDNKIKELQIDYTEMMREHRQLNEDWKTKKEWEAFQKLYKELTQEVLQEKVEFRASLEKQCEEIQSAANQLLGRFDVLFSTEETAQNLELNKHREFLTLRSQENPDDLMALIMVVDALDD